MPHAVFETAAPYTANPSIWFTVGGRPGVRLEDARHTAVIADLDNRETRPRVTNTSTRVTLRISVCVCVCVSIYQTLNT